MQPFAHALTSTRGTGRCWQDDLPIHEFMDLAKHACPDLRHRLVLHNADLGPELAARAFPHRSDARDIALAHVREDIGWLPSLADWLDRFDARMLPRVRPSADREETFITAAVDYYRLSDPTPVRSVWELLALPERLAPSHAPAASLLLFSSFGPILARAVLGPPTVFPRSSGGDAIVDYGWIAEGMIVARFGLIHSLERILQGFDGQEPPRRKSTVN